MERLYRRFKARGLTILALSIDAGGPEPVEAFAKRLGLTFPIGLDPNLEIANLYTVRGLPASFLIDRSGRIAAVALGPRDWDSRAAHAVMEVLLK
jgi:peroxiredoxin